MKRRVLVMADLYGPLYEWDEAGELLIADIDALPLSPIVREQLRAWAQDWQGASGQNYGTLRPDHAIQLRRQGHRLAEVVRRELGDDFDVHHAEVPDRGAAVVPELSAEE